jgi:uncharacterized repeat protein (TIGR03803 family)
MRIVRACTLKIVTAVVVSAFSISLAACGGLPVASGSLSNDDFRTPMSSKEMLLHSFDYTDGAYDTYAGLVFDAAGNLYGTTQLGGTSTCGYVKTCGVVFELTRGASGDWTETVLHDFYACDPLGIWPRAGLTIDAKGNLYGTTDAGGLSCASVEPGTVFELSPNGTGQWTAKALYQFLGANDGAYPQAALTFDAHGNLYGTTSEGGEKYDGTIFELTLQHNGIWLKRTLHSFTNAEGYGPASKLTFDKSGNLYGTSNFGGAYRSGCGGYGCGTAFQLKPDGSGLWTLKVLHSFGNGVDGAGPVSALTIDSAGNLFGVTAQGGRHGSGCLAYGCGTVYELVRGKTDKWTERIIHDFGSKTDGSLPRGDLVFDDSGALYGTAVDGGLDGDGIAFQLVPGANGKWKETILHDFRPGKDGIHPYSGMIFDQAANLYGTTAYGGNHRTGICRKSRGCGAIFEITR